MQRKHAHTILVLFLSLFATSPVLAVAGDYSRFVEGAIEGITLHATPKKVPDLTFQDAGGRTVSLSEFKGQVTLIALWATWCPYCRMDMPHINDLQAKFGGSGLKVLPISVDAGGLEVVQLYYKEKELGNLSIYLDPQSNVGTALGTGGLPYFILIDRNGNEIGRKPGETNWMAPEAQKFIQAILN